MHGTVALARCQRVTSSPRSAWQFEFGVAQSTRACEPRSPAKDALLNASMAVGEPTCLRGSNFWIFPVEVLGNSPNTTVRGTLNVAMCYLKCETMSSAVVSMPRVHWPISPLRICRPQVDAAEMRVSHSRSHRACIVPRQNER